MEQCCVNADLQLPTKQREAEEEGEVHPKISCFNNIHKWKVPKVIKLITVEEYSFRWWWSFYLSISN